MKPVHLRVKPGDIARKVIAAGDPARVEQLSTMLRDSVLVNKYRGFITYTGFYGDERFTVCCHGVGGPSSAIVFEELAMLGAKVIIRLGSTGGLIEGLSRGDLVIPSGAAYSEGSLRMYVPDGILPAVPDLELTYRLLEACRAEGLKPTVGLVFSSDAFYAEDRSFVEEWAKRGVVSIEMECATLFTLAALRGFKASAVLLVDDSLVGGAEKNVAASEELTGFVERAAKAVFRALIEFPV